MSDKNNHSFIEVLEGPDKGLRIDLKPGLITLGRSRENDYCLVDPILSRKHCRFENFEGIIKVCDLESANGTYLNEREVTSAVVKNGDKIKIGDNLLSVFIPEEKAVTSPAGVVVDLGFDKSNEADYEHKGQNWRPFLYGLGTIAVLCIGASFILRTPAENNNVGAVTQISEDAKYLPLEIEYEKVEASTNSAFRYYLTLKADLTLSVAIDDVFENRHIRKDQVISSNSVNRLAKQLRDMNYFRLSDGGNGASLKDSYRSFDISVVANRKVYRQTVVNSPEPDDFRAVRDLLETFSQNELGIWAIQYPSEKLREMAEEAFTRGVNLYDQREVAHGNISKSIRYFKDAIANLETIDPKPDFYTKAVEGLKVAEEDLEARHAEYRFRAEKAINLKDWEQASAELIIILEQIPDRNDPRHAEASRKLLDVENRIKNGSR